MKQIGVFKSKAWGDVSVHAGYYGGPDGPLSIQLMLADGEPLARLSVNMSAPESSHDSRDLPPGCFYVKQWSENAEIAEEALASGLFKVCDDMPPASSGFVVAPVWKFLGSLL